MEIGQKSLCPVCSKNVPETIGQQEQPPASAPDTSLLQEAKSFLDEKADAWKDCFDEQFQDREFEEYQKLYQAAEKLWTVRTCFVRGIENAGSPEKMDPGLMISVMKMVQTEVPDIPIDFARKWFAGFFQQKQNRQEELDPVERNIVKLRNQFMDNARKVFGEDFRDYDQHMEVSFIDFGCSRGKQSFFYERLKNGYEIPLAIGFYELDKHDEDSLLDAFAVVLARCCPSAVKKKQGSFSKITGFGSNIAEKYRTLALTGKKTHLDRSLKSGS